MLSLQSFAIIIVKTESLYTDNRSFREKWLLRILISHKKLLILFRGIFRFITLFTAYFAKRSSILCIFSENKDSSPSINNKSHF